MVLLVVGTAAVYHRWHHGPQAGQSLTGSLLAASAVEYGRRLWTYEACLQVRRLEDEWVCVWASIYDSVDPS